MPTTSVARPKANRVPQGTRGGKLKTAPIMVYPNSAEERKMFDDVARSEGRSLSNFMVMCANEYTARRRAIAK